MNKIKELVEEKGIRTKDLAEMLGITPGQVSNLKSGRQKPSKRIEKLIDAIFFEGRKPHPDPIIEKVIVMMEEMDTDTKENALSCVQKEKLLTDLMKQKRGKVAA
ncbi:helix-turn-helix transcriptional regulator [Geobacter sp. FeAm09]|uniref:helix-turn-helix domain-containing protein n=1 Tax=Geobacter sp. FeAm09 TaxID=2597769 RepID=UPI0011EFBF98|nr:helix-turn-helix transcriptional regulator [Geobacter sp. FeAm09]QEM68233.1 helix-turn-helix transcriptional regulator [Geobacter sp. FeAm09]